MLYVIIGELGFCFFRTSLLERAMYLYPHELLSWVRIFWICVTARLASYDFLITAQIVSLNCWDRHVGYPPLFITARFDIGALHHLERGDDLAA